jgi:hypothetical protein
VRLLLATLLLAGLSLAAQEPGTENTVNAYSLEKEVVLGDQNCRGGPSTHHCD